MRLSNPGWTPWQIEQMFAAVRGLVYGKAEVPSNLPKSRSKSSVQTAVAAETSAAAPDPHTPGWDAKPQRFREGTVNGGIWYERDTRVDVSTITGATSLVVDILNFFHGRDRRRRIFSLSKNYYNIMGFAAVYPPHLNVNKTSMFHYDLLGDSKVMGVLLVFGDFDAECGGLILNEQKSHTTRLLSKSPAGKSLWRPLTG
ncbi:hypothetical protein HKX48_008423 [Thoreauomyces humboldtii]|nr:hypothetical protein HKX48_008423 [Thoreauomyces humboldtii]